MPRKRRDTKTEKDHALSTILDRVVDLADGLAEQAVTNVAETGQSASFSVRVKIEPTEEGKDVKVVTSGQITLSAGQTTDHMNVSEQLRLDGTED